MNLVAAIAVAVALLMTGIILFRWGQEEESPSLAADITFVSVMCIIVAVMVPIVNILIVFMG